MSRQEYIKHNLLNQVNRYQQVNQHTQGRTSRHVVIRFMMGASRGPHRRRQGSHSCDSMDSPSVSTHSRHERRVLTNARPRTHGRGQGTRFTRRRVHQRHHVNSRPMMQAMTTSRSNSSRQATNGTRFRKLQGTKGPRQGTTRRSTRHSTSRGEGRIKVIRALREVTRRPLNVNCQGFKARSHRPITRLRLRVPHDRRISAQAISTYGNSTTHKTSTRFNGYLTIRLKFNSGCSP